MTESAVILIEALLYIFGLSIALAVIGGGLALLVAGKSGAGRVFRDCLSVGLAMGLPAYAAGYLAAFSRVAVMGDVLPAILALFGGLLVYLFGTDAKHRWLSAFAVGVFSVVFFFAAELGSFRREADRIERLITLSDQEAELRQYRENRGLAADPPEWLLSTEPR